MVQGEAGGRGRQGGGGGRGSGGRGGGERMAEDGGGGGDVEVFQFCLGTCMKWW